MKSKGRKTKEETVTNEELKKLADAWIADNGYPDKMNWASFARFVQNNGVDISRTSLMRRDSLKAYIDEQISIFADEGICGAGYQTLDINTILKSSKEKIRDVLKTLDAQRKQMSKTIEVLRAKVSQLESDNRELKTVVASLNDHLNEQKAQIKEFKEYKKEALVLRKELKNRQKEEVSSFYDDMERTGVKPNGFNYIDVDTDPTEIEKSQMKSRLAIVTDNLREEKEKNNE